MNVAKTAEKPPNTPSLRKTNSQVPESDPLSLTNSVMTREPRLRGKSDPKDINPSEIHAKIVYSSGSKKRQSNSEAVNYFTLRCGKDLSSKGHIQGEADCTTDLLPEKARPSSPTLHKEHNTTPQPATVVQYRTSNYSKKRTDTDWPTSQSINQSP